MYDSRIPRIVADLADRVDQVTREAADTVADRAKRRVPVDTGSLKRSIRAQKVSRARYTVVAGTPDVFYGHLVEYGEAKAPARPFLVPALEESREEITRAARTRLGGL